MVDKLDFPFSKPDNHGVVRQVSDGVFWLRMPLPFALDHINLWLLRDGTEWLVVDAGLNSTQIRHEWQKIFSEVLGRGKIRRLLCTHFHPDHIGLASWLIKETGCDWYIAEDEWRTGKRVFDDIKAEFVARQNSFYAENGIGKSWLDALAKRGNAYRQRVSGIDDRYFLLRDGQEISIDGAKWRVITARGHAPEQSCLYCAEKSLLISGDHILPSITPNITLYQPDAAIDPLTQYLDSFSGFRDIEEDVLVLPSHGLPFRGLGQRIQEICEHHGERLDSLLQACHEPRTAGELIPVLFRRQLDVHQMSFAAGECLAHLEYLYRQGRIGRQRQKDRLVRYRTAAS